jgi:UDP-N-acetylmuramoyl-L-alanyl-D-glutamate--2,6-diaminopimelate ligase
MKIIEDIKRGFQRKDSHIVVPDREAAIKRALEMADKDDIVLIAGKGHENYQTIGREKVYFNDKEVAVKYLEV